MRTIVLPYLQICTAKGHRYGYYRRTGIRTRIPGEVGSPAFLAAYQAIHAEAEAHAKPRRDDPAAIPGSLKALWLAYRASGEWRALSAGTRAGYTRLIEPLLPRWGDFAVKLMPPEWIVRRRDELAATPSKANHFLAVIRLLLAWSLPRGWTRTNPTAGIKRIRHRAVSHRVWTQAEIAAMTGAGAETIALPVIIALYTAQRLGDVLKLPWSAYDGQRIIVTQEKTGARVAIPVHPALRGALNAVKENRRATIICTRPDGASWQVDHFKHHFAEVRRKVGMPDSLHFHGLRHSAATRLAEAGCSPHEIAAITGHKTLAMVARYTQGVQQEALATAAITRLRKQKPNRVVQPPNRKV